MDIQIERVLDKLEEEIRGGKKALFGNLRAVDDTKCLEYIASIRNLLPSSITEASSCSSTVGAGLHSSSCSCPSTCNSRWRQDAMRA